MVFGAETSFADSFDSLEAFADAVSEALQSQLTIEDAHHNVIAYSSHQFESDPARIATIVGRRVPDAVIAGLRKQGVMTALEAAAGALRIPAIAEIGLGPRLAICVKWQEEVVGYIWVVDSGELPAHEAERIVEKAAESAKFHLHKQRSRRMKDEKRREEFFWKLLSGYTSSEALIAQDAEKIAITLPPAYFVLVIRLYRNVTAQMLGKLNQLLATQFQISPLFLSADEDQAVALLSVPNVVRSQTINQPIGKQLVTSWMEMIVSKLAESSTMSIHDSGCSAVYHHYARAADAYQEVQSLLAVKKMLPYHTKAIWQYEDLGFLMHMPLIMEQRKKSDRRSSLLSLLRMHDDEHQSELLRTIAVYLSCDRDLKTAAAYLHIHLNTLHYRLNRITDITGHHLKETHYMLSLYVDLLVEETALMNQILK